MNEDRPARDNEDDVCMWRTMYDTEEWPHLIPCDGRVHTLQLHCQCEPLVMHWAPGERGAVMHHLPTVG